MNLDIHESHGLNFVRAFRLRTTAATRPLGYSRFFTWAEYSRMRRGFVPRERSDKWLVLTSPGKIYFFRSGNGTFVYGVRFRHERDGFLAGQAWVNSDPEQVEPMPAHYDRRLLDFLIDRLLLGRETGFPIPPGTGVSEAGVLEKIWMG